MTVDEAFAVLDATVYGRWLESPPGPKADEERARSDLALDVLRAEIKWP